MNGVRKKARRRLMRAAYRVGYCYSYATVIVLAVPMFFVVVFEELFKRHKTAFLLLAVGTEHHLRLPIGLGWSRSLANFCLLARKA